jgi:ankyrin repeat protein
MLELLASHGATWMIPTDTDDSLTYADIAATGLRRSAEVLGYYGDVGAAAPLFEADPALANDAAALEAAAGQGHEDFVRLQLRYHPDLPKRVIVSRPREMAELLFAHGMDPNRPNWMARTPLHHFAGAGDVESATLYLDHGADINARDAEECRTPLGVAARGGKIKMVELLLSRGARRRLPDDPPWATALAVATRHGHEAIARLLELS